MDDEISLVVIARGVEQNEYEIRGVWVLSESKTTCVPPHEIELSRIGVQARYKAKVFDWISLSGRVPATPMTLVFDAITSPVQIPFLIWYAFNS